MKTSEYQHEDAAEFLLQLVNSLKDKYLQHVLLGHHDRNSTPIDVIFGNTILIKG